NKNFIGVKNPDTNAIFVVGGEWQNFIKSNAYRLRKEANEKSRVWHHLLQVTCRNAVDDVLGGNGNVFKYQSAISEMAKEPRYMRRAVSESMIKAVQNFPENIPRIARNLSLMPSFYKDVAYVFLQIKHPNIIDYDNEYRPRKQRM